MSFAAGLLKAYEQDQAAYNKRQEKLADREYQQGLLKTQYSREDERNKILDSRYTDEQKTKKAKDKSDETYRNEALKISKMNAMNSRLKTVTDGDNQYVLDIVTNKATPSTYDSESGPQTLKAAKKSDNSFYDFLAKREANLVKEKQSTIENGGDTSYIDTQLNEIRSQMTGNTPASGGRDPSKLPGMSVPPVTTNTGATPSAALPPVASNQGSDNNKPPPLPPQGTQTPVSQSSAIDERKKVMQRAKQALELDLSIYNKNEIPAVKQQQLKALIEVRNAKVFSGTKLDELNIKIKELQTGGNKAPTSTSVFNRY